MKKFIGKIFFLIVVLFSTIFTINAIDKNLDPEINFIPIAMATDNNYVYPTAVAMTSLLENKKENTYVEFNIMISGEVSPENKTKLKKFETLYDNCRVNLINMRNAFSKTYIGHKERYTSPTYYRLDLPSILSRYDKVIYLDGDIIVRKDLWDMFCTDIGNNYICGVLDVGFNRNKRLKPKFEKEYSKKLKTPNLNQYVNAGVLILNLQKMREDNMQKAFHKFIPELKKRKLRLNDQDILNSTCYGHIKILPKEFNVYPKHYITDSKKLSKSPYFCKDPTIVHYATKPKPWENKRCKAYKTWEKYKKIAIKKIYNGKDPLFKTKRKTK